MVVSQWTSNLLLVKLISKNRVKLSTWTIIQRLNFKINSNGRLTLCYRHTTHGRPTLGVTDEHHSNDWLWVWGTPLAPSYPPATVKLTTVRACAKHISTHWTSPGIPRRNVLSFRTKRHCDVDMRLTELTDRDHSASQQLEEIREIEALMQRNYAEWACLKTDSAEWNHHILEYRRLSRAIARLLTPS